MEVLTYPQFSETPIYCSDHRMIIYIFNCLCRSRNKLQRKLMTNLNPRYNIFEEISTLKKTQYLSQLITDVIIRINDNVCCVHRMQIYQKIRIQHQTWSQKHQTPCKLPNLTSKCHQARVWSVSDPPRVCSRHASLLILSQERLGLTTLSCPAQNTAGGG